MYSDPLSYRVVWLWVLAFSLACWLGVAELVVLALKLW